MQGKAMTQSQDFGLTWINRLDLQACVNAATILNHKLTALQKQIIIQKIKGFI